ncbi:hypothetical protein RJ640_030012, partial [Escallonia rubra]
IFKNLETTRKGLQLLNKAIDICILQPFAQQEIPPFSMAGSYLLPHLTMNLHYHSYCLADPVLGELSIFMSFLNFHSNFQVSFHQSCIDDLITHMRQQDQLTLVNHGLGQGPRTAVCDKAPHGRVCQNQLLLNPTSMDNTFPTSSLLKSFWQSRLNCLGSSRFHQVGFCHLFPTGWAQQVSDGRRAYDAAV